MFSIVFKESTLVPRMLLIGSIFMLSVSYKVALARGHV
jgi:hypothetical protein